MERIETAIWTAPPISQTPVVELIDWSAVRLPTGKVRLIGYDPEVCEGRVSTSVKEFESATKTATTRSGRKYVLTGDPGWSEAGWRVFRRMWGDTDFTDVTEDFL